MVDLNDIAVFTTVTQLGSFSKAARSLAMPVSTVSRRVSELERQLGVTLLQRTTRKLTLTTPGREYFDQCSEPLRHLYDAERVLTRAQRQPQGVLRVSVPVILGDPAFLTFVSEFLRRYPGIQIDLFITNLFLDLIAENIDVAIRFGALKSSTVVTRKLGDSVRWVMAAPAFLEGRALPREPTDLANHPCVLLNATNQETEWQLASGRSRARVRVAGAISSRDFLSVSFFTQRGHGIGLLPSSYCEGPLASGALVRLLPRWSSPSVAVHAIYPSRKFLPEKLHVFLEALRGWPSPFWSRI
jgi:DNA-binding transcriptional LysR family regulator